MADEDGKMPLTSHLDELRKRLIVCFISVFVGFILSYGFKERIFTILTKPLISVMQEGDKLIYTGLAEAFITYLKVSLISGIILSVPIIFYQFWMFISPGLYENEKRLIIPITFFCSFFFIIGCLFAYFIVFPYGFKFFLGFSSETIKPLLSMIQYLDFSSQFLLVFGLVFELPFFITFLARMGIVSSDFLKKNRRYAILIIFIVAAILTPPDVVSQSMMAFPLMILYEISIIGAKIFGKKESKGTDCESNQAAG
ncbi:MAG: twin-arginine translocase subunit TatC [Desulfobacterales bacterium]|nr:twin-arginine translocase subunit TatC [Desulfobacterales bacterium]MBF0397228.1 twin-arginine translocase subunit TatC [Desulfobacterales bacterium]